MCAKCSYYILLHIRTLGNNVDFNSTTQTAVITAGTNSSTVSIPVMNDNIVEGDEMFTMNLNVPASLGPGIIAGAITMATATIIDTNSKLQQMEWCIAAIIHISTINSKRGWGMICHAQDTLIIS